MLTMLLDTIQPTGFILICQYYARAREILIKKFYLHFIKIADFGAGRMEAENNTFLTD